jgi:hypothetical protein
MTGVVLEKLVYSFNGESECDRLAETFPLDGMGNYWLFVALVVNIQLDTFYPLP